MQTRCAGDRAKTSAVSLRGTGAASIGALVLGIGCGDVSGPVKPIEGKVLYEQYCARCHGPDGKPIGKGVGSIDFSQRTLVDQRSDEALKGVIMKGRGTMPSFGAQFTDAAMMVLIAHLRGLSGSQGPHAPPPPEDVEDAGEGPEAPAGAEPDGSQ